jgi:hypothetical protein
MTDVTDVASTTVAQPELKSADTSVVNKITAEAAKAEPVKAEPAVEAKVEETAVQVPEGDEADAPDAGSEAAKPGKNSWKKRLERVRQTAEAETRANVLKELIDQGVIKPPKPPQEAVVETKAEKSLEDFDYDQDAYLEYKLERKLEQREAKQREAEEQKRQAETAKQFEAKVSEFEQRVGEGAWQEVLESPINLDPEFKPLAAMIEGDDLALDIAHHLASNPDKAEEIIKLSPLKMALEVAKIAEQLGGKQSEKPAPVLPKKTTNAPPPPKTVTGSGKPSVDVNSPDLTPEQRIAMWRKRG